MAASAGWNVQIRSFDTAQLTATGEAMSQVGSSLKYRIDTESRRLWDWTDAANFIIYDNAIDDTSDVAEWHWLEGAVTMTTTPAGAITADITYLATDVIALVSDFNFTVERESIDISVMDPDKGYRERILGMHKLTGSMTLYDTGFADLDDNDATSSLRELLLEDGKYVCIQVRIGGSATTDINYQFIIGVNSLEVAASTEGAQTLVVNFETHAVNDGTYDNQVNFFDASTASGF